jgi:hypothetical protein
MAPKPRLEQVGRAAAGPPPRSARGAPYSRLVPAQEAFDEAVRTNLEDFGMEVRTRRCGERGAHCAAAPRRFPPSRPRAAAARGSPARLTRPAAAAPQPEEAVQSAVEEFEMQVRDSGQRPRPRVRRGDPCPP